MLDPHDFAKKQSELAAEFAKYVLDHPEVDDSLSEDSYIYFQITGETDFNEQSRTLAMKRRDEEGMKIVCVQIRGLAPPQGSRLINPQITPSPSIA